MEVKILVEDSLKEVYEQPGVKQAIETAVHKEFLKQRDDYYARQSRQTFSRGFVGTAKEQK